MEQKVKEAVEQALQLKEYEHEVQTLKIENINLKSEVDELKNDKVGLGIVIGFEFFVVVALLLLIYSLFTSDD